MTNPQIRPGKVAEASHPATVVALFRNSAQANSVIQLAIQLGVPSAGLGIAPPDEMPGGQGALVTFPCPSESVREQIQGICKAQGAVVQTQRR